MITYPVAGGWHAQDESFRIASFGKTEAEAMKCLESAKELILRLAGQKTARKSPNETAFRGR
jgi:predicted RNase H-like HicB family nuclease